MALGAGVFRFYLNCFFFLNVSYKESNSHRKFYKTSVMQKAVFECSCSALVGEASLEKLL